MYEQDMDMGFVDAAKAVCRMKFDLNLAEKVNIVVSGGKKPCTREFFEH
jgi:hypothetical protein